MTLPLVSIGIPSWNRADYLARAIHSVRDQTYPGRIEIVVIDDGSTDDTPQLIAELRRAADEWENRTLLAGRNDANAGIAHAKNQALAYGSGAFRGILDADDYYQLGFVERCVSALLADPALGMVYTDNAVVGPSGQELPCPPAGDWSLDTLLNREIRGDCYLARWSALERTHMHDPRFELEVDYELYYQLIGRTHVKRIPEVLMTVQQHGGRTSRQWQKAAYWHAAGLGKYGHSIEWAYRRAGGRLGDWKPTIDAGYARGKEMARERRAVPTHDITATLPDSRYLA